MGLQDVTRGTLFHEILEILAAHLPRYVILENVGNFERHDGGRTWAVVRDSLIELGYHVKGTEHVATGGHGLISPHHLGFPHSRERFFIVAALEEMQSDPFPPRNRTRKTSLKDIEQKATELSPEEKRETAITPRYVECIDHWNAFLQSMPRDLSLPSFPIWGDEFGARYPYRYKTPYSCSRERLERLVNVNGSRRKTKAELLEHLPSYARTREIQFPKWKTQFIRQNREFFREVDSYLSIQWRRELRAMPSSFRKFEWNCQGEERNLWNLVLQFRPSGLRAKRYSSSPALVSMTCTQIPILGPQRRFLSRVEGLRLQGFPDSHRLPNLRERSFHALGNAVHVGVVQAILKNMIGKH
jgi:DNA (cytosine-5)-methyltransferase 1